MPIYRLLQNSDFQPEHITLITAAFEDVCRALGLAERDDPFRDMVAKAILDCAQGGDLDPIRLRKCAHEVLGR